MNVAPYENIPLVKGLPLIGNLLTYLRDPLAEVQSLALHGNVVRSRTFFEHVTLLGPDANQFVLHDREGNFSSRGGWAYFIDAVFPGAIMAMDDPQHKHHRRNEAVLHSNNHRKHQREQHHQILQCFSA